MSRETFVVRATLQSATAAKGEKAAAGAEVLIHIPHIVTIVDTTDGSNVQLSTGVVINVTQKMEYFINKGKAYNVFKELAQ